jgi:hypothetical protein
MKGRAINVEDPPHPLQEVTARPKVLTLPPVRLFPRL